MARVQHTAFDAMHPVVPAVFVTLTLGLTMAAVQPVLVGISLACALAFAACVRGLDATARSLRWQLPMVLVIALLNPLFSASGSTELFRWGLRAVYLESICYGLCMGGLFMASALWLQGAAVLLPFEKVTALLGSAVPVVSLMISQCMRLIPRFVRQGRSIIDAQAATTLSRARSGDGVRARLRASTVLMAWSMEDALETADAMRARGWGAARRRSTYARYRFTSADALTLAGIGLAGAVVVAVAYAAASQFSFYPVMPRLVAWWGYAPYAAWMAAPAILHGFEAARFR